MILLNKVWKCFINLSITFGNHSYLIKLQSITLFEKPLQHNVGLREHLSMCLFLFFLSCGNSLKSSNSLRLIITNWPSEMWKESLLDRRLWEAVHAFSINSVMYHSSWHHGLEPPRLLCPWGFPSKNTGVGCHTFPQGIFPIQGSNPHLPHCRWILYLPSHWGSPRWVVHDSSCLSTLPWKSESLSEEE